ncbi:MAG: flagellar biosynthetic protein FliO [Gammaproteobacteria bacterium]|nr:flagellar biosynthetic protein FliO [Gammaproteobacteria bacterium]
MRTLPWLLLGLYTNTAFAVIAEPKKTPVLAESDIAGSLIQTTLGLLFIVLLILGAAWAVKRFGHFNVGAQGQLKVVGGVSLGQRERAVLLQVGEKQLVVGVTQGHIQTLLVLDEPLSVEPGPVKNTSFAERLSGAITARQSASSSVDSGSGGHSS